MKRKFYKFTALTLGAFMAASSAYAVPARPVAVEVTQPDGSVVMLRPAGDEYFHCFLTEDGYVVSQDADGWYRVIGNDGKATDLVATEVNARSQAYSSSLAAISPETAFTKMQQATLQTSKLAAYRDERQAARKNAPAKASKWDNTDGHDLREFPTEGKQNVLVILVSFQDKEWSFCDDPHTEMQNMLQQPGYSNYDCTGSAYDYFTTSSGNIFRPQFDVYGPVKLSRNMSYYGGNDSYGNDLHPEMMVVEACQILHDEGVINFADYDRDGDGVVDNVYVFYAGNGENEGAPSYTVWPHSWDIRSAGSSLTLDGVQIGHYACSNEVIYRTNTMTGIGTFCHEFSHVLGLPDLYATSYTSAHTPGDYSLMDSGSYNNNGRTPPIYSSYERYALEWQKPYEITGGEDISMICLTDAGNTYKITIDSSKPTEYFLFENRQHKDNDLYLEGHGMLVWHIDYKESKWTQNVVNNTPSDQCVDIVEADNSASDSDMAGDTFPGTSSVTSFTADTKPAFQNKNSGTKSSLPITEITETSDGLITFKVADGGVDGESSYYVETPACDVAAVTSDSFTLNFPAASEAPAKGKGAGGEIMYLTVESTTFNNTDEAFESTTVDGYCLRRVDTASPVVVTGLKSGTPYSVKLYRFNDSNISKPYELSVITASDDFASTSPIVNVANIEGQGADVEWTAVEGADHYLLTVATREVSDNANTVTVNFDSSPRVPSGWDYSGSFSSASGTYGQASASFYMSLSTDFLWSKYYADDEFSGIQFWSRTSKDLTSSIKVYSATETGALSLIGTISGINNTAATYELKGFPEGVHSVVLLPVTASNNRVYIDDLVLTMTANYTDTPVAGYSDKVVNDTKETVAGLDFNTEYVTYVKAHNGSEAGARSAAVTFRTAEPEGVGTIAASKTCGFVVANGIVKALDATTEFDVYAVDGSVVAKGAKGTCTLPARGAYLIICGAKGAKVVW